MHAHHDSRIPLENIIEALTTNNPEMKKLNFQSILVNPTIKTDPDGSQQIISHIKDEDLQLLAEAIKENTTLEHFEIHYLDSTFSQEWTHVGSEAVGDALKNHPKLRYVSLNLGRYSSYRAFQFGILFGFLKCLAGNAKIEALDLCFSTTFERDSPKALNEIGEFLSKSQSPCLKEIYIQGCTSKSEHIYPVSLTSFVEGLAIHKDLEVIKFNNLRLGDTGIQEVARSIFKTTHSSEEEKAVP